MQATHTISADVFNKLPTVELITLDPLKPYVVRVPENTPDQFIVELSKSLSAAGIFAIIITTNVKFYSTFPVDIKLTKREIEVQVEEQQSEKPARKRAAKKATTKKKSSKLKKFSEELENYEKEQK